MTETVIVKLPPDRVYPSLLEYLYAQPDVKVKRCLEPSLIETNIGWSPRRLSIFVKIEILPESEGSRVRISFDFSGYWRQTLPWIILLWAPLILFTVWMKNIAYLEYSLGLPLLILALTYFQTNVKKGRNF